MCLRVTERKRESAGERLVKETYASGGDMDRSVAMIQHIHWRAWTAPFLTNEVYNFCLLQMCSVIALCMRDNRKLWSNDELNAERLHLNSPSELLIMK